MVGKTTNLTLSQLSSFAVIEDERDVFLEAVEFTLGASILLTASFRTSLLLYLRDHPRVRARS